MNCNNWTVKPVGLLKILAFGWFLTQADGAKAQEGQVSGVELLVRSTQIQSSTNPSIGVYGNGLQDQVNEVYVSEDLINWSLWRIAQHTPFEFKKTITSDIEGSFFKVESLSLESALPWKHLVRVEEFAPALERFLTERFLSSPVSYDYQPIQWIKFAIRWDDEADPEVVFQNSSAYAFHYDFLTAHWEGLRGMSREEVDQITLFAANRKILLGAALFPIHVSTREAGIQLVSQDPLSFDDTQRALRLVSESIHSLTPIDVYYMPTFHQTQVAQTTIAELEATGVKVDTADRWSPGAGIYSPGWAMGRLVYLESSEIEVAYITGELTSQDILITDGTPAEIPRLAGVISLSPSSPSSHVAILAAAYGIPFAYLKDPSQRETAMSLTGKRIYFAANRGFVFNQSDPTRIRLIDLEPYAGNEVVEALPDLKSPPLLEYPIREVAGVYWKPVAELGYEDISKFGGKASYFHLLTAVIPENSPEAIAFSLDLWNEYLDQTMPWGSSLRESISDRLSGLASTNEPSLELEAALEDIQDWIEDDADFNAQQKGIILEAVSRFDIDRKIRFRSSTNVEDTESFVGAGLYDSYSGCRWDDLDDDEEGPSHCDSEKPKERGVFRAMRKVYASFYNLNAYLERTRRGVNETEVGMGILAHYSYPDEIELANGVGQVEQLGSGSFNINLDTQVGAVSVSNPDPGVEPEQVSGFKFSGSERYFMNLDRQSSLVILGDHVLDWEAEYIELAGLLHQVMLQYLEDFPEKENVILDFEYKKTPDGLSIKQVRPLPIQDSESNEVEPRLIQSPTWTYATYQEEMGEIFGMHRLKSRWRFSIDPIQLSAQAPSDNPLEAIEIEYISGTEIVTWQGEVGELEAFEYQPSRGSRVMPFSWSMDIHSSADVGLEISNYPESTNSKEDPVISLDDALLVFSAIHPDSQPQRTFEGFGKGREDITALRRDFSEEPVPALAILKTREAASRRDGIKITTSFYWPPEPTGAVAGYTAPLLSWDSTTIEGIPGLDEAVVLEGFFSQTYHPGHHNFWEEFLFDPFLEPDMDPAILEHFEASNVRWIYVSFGLSMGPNFEPQVYFISPDGSARQNW